MYKEQFEYIEKIGIDRIALLFRFGNAELFSNIFVIDYICDIAKRCRTFYTDDTEKDYIYKSFVLCGNCNDAAEFLKRNNLGYKEKQPNGKYRIDHEEIWWAIEKADYHDLEINLFAYILFNRKNVEMDYIKEQVQLIKEQYNSMFKR